MKSMQTRVRLFFGSRSLRKAPVRMKTMTSAPWGKAMSEVCADLPLPAAGMGDRPVAARTAYLWDAAILLAVAGALVRPAQRIFRLSSSVPFDVAAPISPAQAGRDP